MTTAEVLTTTCREYLWLSAPTRGAHFKPLPKNTSKKKKRKRFMEEQQSGICREFRRRSVCRVLFEQPLKEVRRSTPLSVPLRGGGGGLLLSLAVLVAQDKVDDVDGLVSGRSGCIAASGLLVRLRRQDGQRVDVVRIAGRVVRGRRNGLGRRQLGECGRRVLQV